MKRIKLALPSPYVGLRPFYEREALLFFGRDAHVHDLLAKLERRQRFLAVLGASGTGKSSLVRAGLIPALRRGALAARAAAEAAGADAPGGEVDRWNACILTPGDAPLAQLAHALTEDERWVDNANRPLAEASLAALLGASPLALTTLYRQKAARFEREALLLVVDQFEEIFRYRQRNPDEADSFVKLLLRSASEDVPIYVVMTMRSDFLGNAVAIHGLAEAINSGIYLTPRLGPEQIRSVIASPLSLVGGSIDPVLANRLVNTLSGEDELPVLEHALLRMWDRAKAADRSSIEVQDYVAICGPRGPTSGTGGAGGAVAPGEPALPLAIDNHASEIHDGLTPSQQTVVRQLFLALVERQEGRDVRRPQTLRELRDLVGADAEGALNLVLDAYRAAGVGFVLPPANRDLADSDLIDISHESLIRRWRMLQGWLEEEARDVAELHEWKQRAERRREGGGWLDDNDAARATHWRARVVAHGRPVPWAQRHAGPGAYEFVESYLRESQAHVDRSKAEQEALRNAAEKARIERFELEAQRHEVEAQRQRELAERAAAEQARAEREAANAVAKNAQIRRRGRIAFGVGALALVACAVAWWAYGKAERAKDQATELARKAQAGELARTAEAMRRDLPDTSILLALEARRMDPTSPVANALIRAAEANYPYRLVLRGHTDKLSSARFSEDAKTVVTASGDGTVRLWDASTGQALHVLRGHDGPVNSVEFSPDGKTVLSAGEDQTARLWDVASGKQLRMLLGHKGPLTHAEFSPDGKVVLSASVDQTARLWNAADGAQLRQINEEYALTTARFSPRDGASVLTASLNKARIWAAAKATAVQGPGLRGVQDRRYELRRELEGHTGDITSAQFSVDGAAVLTASKDGTARLWKVVDGKERLVLRGHQGKVGTAAFSSDGRFVVTAGTDKTVRLWDAVGGDELRILRGHEDGVAGAVFSADGKTVLSASADGTARLWNVVDSTLEHALIAKPGGPVVSALFSADGLAVLTAEGAANTTLRFDTSAPFEAAARVWDVAGGKELRAMRGHRDGITLLRLSPDGKKVLTASGDRTARLWSLADGAALGVLSGHESSLTDALFSSDGMTVLTASDDATARLWDVASHKELRRFVVRSDGLPQRVSSIQFSPDEKTVLTASWDGTVRLWNAAGGDLLRTLIGHPTAAVATARFSPPDGKTVLSASWDATARLWNAGAEASADKPLLVLDGHADQLTLALFSPDGRYALTASDDRTARLWEVPTRRYLRTLRGHEGPITAVMFSADGQTVLTASKDATARLWDTESGMELHTLRGHDDTVNEARFSPDGKRIVTASEDASARLWRCAACQSVKVLAAEAEKRIGRSLTPDERVRYAVPTARAGQE